MPKKNMLRRNVQCERQRPSYIYTYTVHPLMQSRDCRPILNAILHKQKFTVWFSWNVAFFRMSFLLMVFFFFSVFSFRCYRRQSFLLSPFIDRLPMVKFIGIAFGVMAFVHESHESRCSWSVLVSVCVCVLTKEPNQRVLDAVTPKIVADLSLFLHWISLYFGLVGSFFYGLTQIKHWTFFCTLTRLLLISNWMISIVIVMVFTSNRSLECRSMIFPAINFVWKISTPFAKSR